MSLLKGSSIKSTLERTAIFLLAVVFIIGQLTHWEPLSLVLGGLVFVTIALLLPRLKGMTLWLTISFLVLGMVLLFLRKTEPSFWFQAAGMNVTIVTLFIFAPLFGIPVRLPEYIEALNRFYEKSVKNKSVLFSGTQVLTQIMGAFLNVGSIPVVYHIVYAKPRPGMNLLLANALNRGFAGAILWSPYFAAMAVVISSLTLRWSSLLPHMLGLAVLSLLVSLAVEYKELLKKEEPLSLSGEKEPEEANDDKETTVFPMGLGIYLVSTIAAVLVLEQLLALPMVLITCLAAVFFPLGWCLAKGAFATYRQGLTNHLTVTLPALQKEMTLFLAAGFFSGSIGATGFGDYIPAILSFIPLPVSVSFSILTVVLIMATSLIGLHPIVLITIFATGVDPASVQISPQELAVLLLGSWGLSNTISPASAVNNLLAGLFQKQVHELAVPNYKYAAAMAVVLLLYLIIVPI
jgi:hypothetical protein